MYQQGYPQCCLNCGLFQSSPYYKIQDLCKQSGEGKMVLIVDHLPDSSGSWINAEDDKTQFLFGILERMVCPFYLTSTLLCEPNSDIVLDKTKNKKVIAEWYSNCKQWLMHTISSLQDRIGCIVALGEAAKNQLLDGNVLTVDAAKKGIWTFKTPYGAEIPLIVANDPKLHFISYKDKGKDLRKEYVYTFDLAQRICRGLYHKPQYNPILIPMESDNDFYLLQQILDKTSYSQAHRIYFDVETRQSKNDRNCYSTLHPQSKIICFTLTWSLPGESSPTVVIIRTRNNSKHFVFQLLMWLLPGKHIVNSNVYFDLMSSIAQMDLNDTTYQTSPEVFPLVDAAMWLLSRITWDDFWLWHTCYDLGDIHYGQKHLIRRLFNEPDYSVNIKDMFNAGKKKNPKFTYEDLPYSEERGMWEVEWYVGLDGYWGWMIGEAILPDLMNPDHPNQMAYQFKKEEIFAAIILTLEGFPVDMEHLQKTRQQIELEVAALEHWTNNHFLVAQCGLTAHNVNSAVQNTAIIDKCLEYFPELADFMERSESGAFWSTSKDSLGMEKLLNHESWVGEYFRVLERTRSLRHLNSTFINMPFEWALDRGRYGWRVHPIFNIGKSDFDQGGDGAAEEKTRGTDSGRWSNVPNTMNIPARIEKEYVAMIRRGYTCHRC